MYLKKIFLITTDIEDIEKKFLNSGLFYILDFSSNPLKYDKYLKKKKFIFVKLPKKNENNINSITDFKKVIKIYKYYLNELALQLNKIHKKNYSISYWELIIGDWLLRFISIVNTRFNLINYVKKKYDVNYILLPVQKKRDLKQSSTNDSIDFVTKIKTDKWNSLLYRQIINFFFNIKIKEFNTLSKENLRLGNKKNFTFLKFLKKIYSYFKLKKIQKVFLYDNNISKKIILFLKLRFFDFPILHESLFVNLFFKENTFHRNFYFSKKKNKLYLLLNYLMPLHIPRVFIEGYKKANQIIENTNWPENPRLIFSSTTFYSHDFFKIWSAKKKEEKKIKFITMQHGSGYFFMRDFAPEYYQRKVSDKIIAWGNTSEKKIISGFNYKSINYKHSNDNSYKKLVFINYELHRHINSTGGQINAHIRHNHYYDFVTSFFTNLKTEIVKSVVIKSQNGSLHNDKYFFEKLGFDYQQNKKNITDYFKQSRVIVIGKIVSTVFLEAMRSNVPVIVFFDKESEFFNSNAKIFVKRLKYAKIVFDDPIKAALHLNTIWSNIDSWWYSKKTQKEINFFCKFFSKKTDSPVNDLFKILQKEIL
jgi:putative transferase (TIGR04331 family)